MSTVQQKKWHILPKISQNFIKQFPEYNQVVLQLLCNRGIISSQSRNDEGDTSTCRLHQGKIKQFLNPDYRKDSHDPFLFEDMQAAVDLIIKHIKEQNRIVVYGDYDADGVTATAVLAETLETLKGKVDIYIPDRVSQGYGLNKKAIDGLAELESKLIITVDSGIRNKEEVEYAINIGLDIIVTDHHAPAENKEELPDCLIINPMMANEKYPFKYLSGVGVAFKLAKALISESKLAKADKQKLENKILDLVAIGTIADCVNLLSENRLLVKQGLGIINQQKRPGLTELIKVAQINSQIDSWNIAWQIAPRLNVAGRLEHANTAYQLLVTKNNNEAQTIARRLNDKNIERQKITEEIVDYCNNFIEKEMLNDRILILVCPEIKKPWPEGVIGLVASRLCEQYSRPVIVITKVNKEFKGSGRSIDEFNIIKAIEQISDNLVKFGGHAGACGFTINSEDKLNSFIKKIKKIANQELKKVDLKSKIVIEKELDLQEINEELIKDLERFAPFGEANPRPKFVSRNVQIRDIMNMGINGQHIKFRVNGLWALAFGQASQWQDLRIGDKVDMVYYAEINEFNGRSKVQLKIVDIKYNTKTKN